MIHAERSLADLWPELGVDERLSILIEQQTVEVRRLAAIPKERLDHYAMGRIAGYASAVADVRYYVVDGNPLPEADEL